MKFHAPTGQFVIEAAALKEAALLIRHSLKSIRELANLPLDQYERDMPLTRADMAQICVLECAEILGIDIGVTRHNFNLLDLRNI